MTEEMNPKNHHTLIVSTVYRESDGEEETDIEFVATIFDPQGAPIGDLTALELSYRPDKHDFAVAIPITTAMDLPLGDGYSASVVATGDFEDFISFENIPIILTDRNWTG